MRPSWLALPPISSFVLIALGRSPVVVAEYLRQAYGLQILDLPLGGLTNVEVSLGVHENAFLERFLPLEALENRCVVVLDFAETSRSLQRARELIEKYVRSRLPTEKQGPVVVAPISHRRPMLRQEHSVMGTFDPDTAAAHRLLKAPWLELDKEPYAPFKSIKYQDVAAGRVDAAALLPDDCKVAALRTMMQLALNMIPKDTIPFQRPRKNHTGARFSFHFGYIGKGKEELFINKLRAETAATLGLGDLQSYVDNTIAAEVRRTPNSMAQGVRFAFVGGVALIFVYILLWGLRPQA